MPLLLPLLVAATFALPCLAQLPAQSLSPAGKTALAEGMESFDKGDTDTAAGLLLQVLAESPRNFEANEDLGLLYAGNGNHAKALMFFEAAVRARSHSAVAHGNLGADLLTLDKVADAAHELGIAARIDPNNVELQTNLGQALVELGKPAEAAVAFATAAQFTTADHDLLYNWGLALYNAHDYAQSALILGRIRKDAQTDQDEALFGDVEERQQHYEAAVLHLRRAAELAPTEPHLYALALELLRHWSWQPALQIAQFGISHGAVSARMQQALGIAQYGKGDYQAAADSFSGLLAAEPTNTHYAELLGKSCEPLATAEQGACKHLQRFATEHPGNAQVDVDAASSILNRPITEQDLTLVSRLLRNAAETDPGRSRTYYLLAVVDQQGLKWQQSVEQLTKALALDPTSAAAHYKLAVAYFHLGDKQHGTEQMRLHQQFDAQEKATLDDRLKSIVLFLVQ